MLLPWEFISHAPISSLSRDFMLHQLDTIFPKVVQSYNIHFSYLRFSDFQKRIPRHLTRVMGVAFGYISYSSPCLLPIFLFLASTIETFVGFYIYYSLTIYKNRCSTLHLFDSHILSYQNTFFSGVMFNVFEPPTVFIIPSRCKSSISSLSISISNCTSFRIFCILSTTKPCSKSKVYPNPAKFNNSPQKKKRPRN